MEFEPVDLIKYGEVYASLCSYGREMLGAYTDLYGPKEALNLVKIHEDFKNWSRDW